MRLIIINSIFRYNFQNLNNEDARYENTAYEPSYGDQYPDYETDYMPDVKMWLENFGHYAGNDEHNINII